MCVREASTYNFDFNIELRHDNDGHNDGVPEVVRKTLENQKTVENSVNCEMMRYYAPINDHKYIHYEFMRQASTRAHMQLCLLRSWYGGINVCVLNEIKTSTASLAQNIQKHPML